MSMTFAASITATPARNAARLPASVYRRRRAVVGAAIAAIVTLSSMVATGTLAGPGGVPASASVAGPALERQRLVAVPGDTLWAIAERYRGEVGHGTYLDALVRLNGGASIQAGQVILLP